MINAQNHTARFFYKFLPLGLYKNLTRQKLIFPYYHAVTDAPGRHIKNIGYFRRKSDFIEDLVFLTKNYIPVSANNIESAKNKAAFHLTFDDGLAEIYNETLPLLVKRKIPATFFINSDFVDNKNMFYRHKISILIEETKNKNKAKVLYKSLRISNIEQLKQYFDKLGFNDVEKIDNLAREIDVSFKDYLQEYKPYLTTKQLTEIKNSGFTLANHSKSHPNFQKISLEEQKFQVQTVNNFLKKVLGINDFYFSFPFGIDNMDKDFFDFLYQQAGIIYSFGTSGIKKDDLNNHFHRIPMEHHKLTAKEIIQYEYFYFMIKALFRKNKIYRT